MERSSFLVSAVMSELRPGDDSGAIIARIEMLTDSKADRRWRLPKGMDADGFFEHLVHRGALQVLPGGSVHCPIPSFQRYMICLGER